MNRAMFHLRRLLAFLAAPLVAGVPAALSEFAAFGRMPSSLGDFLPVLLFVSRFGLFATIVLGIPAALALKRSGHFAFGPLVALGAALGGGVALAVHVVVVPVTIGWALLFCVLPGALGGALFWWIGGWTASAPSPAADAIPPGSGIKAPERSRRRFFAALAVVALGLAAVELVPKEDVRGASSAELQRRARLRPSRRAELFSAAQWEAAAKREPLPGQEDMARMFDRRYPDGMGVIPLDEKLLTRVTFVGRSVREVGELLGRSPTDSGQPFGALHFGMWPMVRECAQPILVLAYEPDRHLERRVVSEAIQRSAVLCVS